MLTNRIQFNFRDFHALYLRIVLLRFQTSRVLSRAPTSPSQQHLSTSNQVTLVDSQIPDDVVGTGWYDGVPVTSLHLHLTALLPQCLIHLTRFCTIWYSSHEIDAVTRLFVVDDGCDGVVFVEDE